MDGYTATVSIGDDVVIYIPENPNENHGRLWRMKYRGEFVRRLRGIYLRARTDGLGLAELHMLKTPEMELPVDLLDYLRKRGWRIRIDELAREPSGELRETEKLLGPIG